MNDAANLPSSFDPNTFLDATVDSPFDTTRTTIPAKDDYIAVIDDVKVRIANTKNGDRVLLELYWEVLADELKISLNLQKVICRQTLWLDFDVNGKLAHGVNQNIQLGQVRDAIGQNTGGAWSPKLLKGAGPARLKVSERIDEKNPAIKYNDVDRVTRLS